MNRNIYLAVAAAVTANYLLACSAGPTKQYVDGKWNVSENICSSDPDRPELGDMRSVIRSHESYQTSFDRQISIFYTDRTVLDVTQKFTRGSQAGEMKLYENTTQNPIIKTTKISNSRELNNAIETGIEEFFSNDPTIDGSDAKSFCLYRSQ